MSPALRLPLPPQSTRAVRPPDCKTVAEPCPTSRAAAVRSAPSASSRPSPMAAHSRTAAIPAPSRGLRGRSLPTKAAARARYAAPSQIRQYTLSVLSDAKGNLPKARAIHRA